MRVETIADLKVRVADLLGDPALSFTDYLDHGVMFYVAGEAHQIGQHLRRLVDVMEYPSAIGQWQCRCDRENWSLLIRGMSPMAFCVASVISRHQRYRLWLERSIQHDREFNASPGRGGAACRSWR